MNFASHSAEPAHPALIAAGAAATSREPRLCATPDCHSVVEEPWDETGTLCARCAIETDLSDREGRWDRCFPNIQ
jgi:hypothetical protein